MSEEAKEKNREYCRRYYYEHQEKRKNAAKAWARAHVEKNRERARDYGRKERGLFIGGEQRKGVCVLCSKETMLVPDHDFFTGKVRDWICNICNMHLGQYEAREADGRNQKYRDYLARFK